MPSLPNAGDDVRFGTFIRVWSQHGSFTGPCNTDRRFGCSPPFADTMRASVTALMHAYLRVIVLGLLRCVCNDNSIRM